MNELQIFRNESFGEIRTISIDNEPWFVGKDVAVALGYSNPNDALNKRVDSEDKMQGDGVAIRDPIGRTQHPTIINESGLYSLVLSSKLPAAKQFKRWITSDYLMHQISASAKKRKLVMYLGGESPPSFTSDVDSWKLNDKTSSSSKF